ncbi:WD repeat-containing protein 73 isoform X2 [Megalops cyprinoides]|uniref:WD repeat-containing protein 73 isoform X2 n=1 Tax=Megalops cyprinoides TaxID=118141 RepID=UPI0018640DE2|nr:WD repeat-containing protein 73 isoform X2 [Megalops cyprinoides]
MKTIYTDLHVFELQQPTQVIEWTAEKSICVAGYSTTNKNEILELLLPQKLFARDNQGLCPERDFRVDHGAFTEEPVNCLRHIPGTRCVVTSGAAGSSLQIWQIGDGDSDVIRKTGCIELKNNSNKRCKIGAGLTETACILHGSELRDIQLTELPSGKVLYKAGSDSSDSVSSLQFVSASVFLVCTESGDLCVEDTRVPSSLLHTPAREQGGHRWCMGLKKGPSPSDAASCKVARLSSSCQVIVSDLRDLRHPLCRAHLRVQHSCPSSDFMNVTWAPALNDHLAVSGFDGVVQIYDTTSWRPESVESQPVFVHRGHMMSSGSEVDTDPAVVTTHVWHPWRPRTVLSAATNGSLHVWDWIDKREASC